MIHSEIRHSLLSIWHAALKGVDVDHLMRGVVQPLSERELQLGQHLLPLEPEGRVYVIGAGKASGRMAQSLSRIFETHSLRIHEGWINVPQHDPLISWEPIPRITLHQARPLGLNEPTEAGVSGTEKMVRILHQAGPKDIVFCLISGGGSALMPLPIEGISLQDKVELTRQLSASGATIEHINIVRQQISQVKGGGLLGRTEARLVTLILSDILGDPLDLIASGPTVPCTYGPKEALAVLDRYAMDLPRIRTVLETKNTHPMRSIDTAKNLLVLIGNNQTAVAAAEREALRQGFSVQSSSAMEPEPFVENIAHQLLNDAIRMPCQALLSGGEPTVRLVPSENRGLGGRNQQLVLAALVELINRGLLDSTHAPGFALLSGGTDGEDGPTDAAGAFLDAEVIADMKVKKLDPRSYLVRNDAYHFFEQTGGLIKTGPTGTNVCDIRIILRRT